MRRVALVLVLLLIAAQAVAQEPPTVNPLSVQFTKSPDHDVMLDTYTPAVADYTLDLYLVGAIDPFLVYHMGKPDPDVNGTILHNFDGTTRLLGWPIAVGSVYEATVSAHGPYGTGRSPRSNAFTYDNQWRCSFSTVPISWLAVPPGGGTLNVQIKPSTSGCRWALTLPVWLTATVMSGTATATTILTAAPNLSGAERQHTLTIGAMRPASFALVQPLLPDGAVPPQPPSNVLLLP